ncbi:MAG: helix-turn-helix domain-containing protein [Spirochaetales bacterium]
MKDIFPIGSISALHKTFGLPKPSHPLISIVRKWPKSDFDFGKFRLTSDLYVVSLKENFEGVIQYGRSSYDFEDGTLVFMGPGQVASFENPVKDQSDAGWSMFFHPDLLRKSELARKIRQFAFFDYVANEALHVSDNEKAMLNDLVEKIDMELRQNIDTHSQELIIVNLESILKYCRRYYDRQFFTRSNLNKDFVARFEEYLEAYFTSDEQLTAGIPTISQCGDAMNMSGPYLSDLLRLETGKSAKEHIHDYVIDQAKNRLLGTNLTVGEVAYSLGFEYPQHFSKLFKVKTGVTPSDYRNR